MQWLDRLGSIRNRADNWADTPEDNRADNQADNWADNQADNRADVNEKKLCLFKITCGNPWEPMQHCY